MKYFFFIPFIIFILAPGLVSAKKKKPNGTHLLIVSSPEEYWKLLGNEAVITAKKLVKNGARITLPFIEEETVTDVVGYNNANKKYYKRGVKAFKKGRYKKAIRKLKIALVKFSSIAKNEGYSYLIRRRISLSYLYLGAAQLLDAQTNEFKTSFRMAYTYYPGYPLPKKAFSDDNSVSVFNKAVEAPGYGTSSIIVNSSITGFVFIDGNLVGVTPLIISGVKAGTHGVSWGRMGYQHQYSKVTVASGMKGVVNFSPPKNGIVSLIKKVKSLDPLLSARKDPPVLLSSLAKKSRVSNIIIFRGSANDTEISWYQNSGNSWQKRVRRSNAVPGNLIKDLYKLLLKPKPVIDLGTVVGNSNKCYSNRDCPGGECMGGQCISTTPVYKKWWFWTAISVGVVALGGGGYMLYQVKNRPGFTFSTP